MGSPQSLSLSLLLISVLCVFLAFWMYDSYQRVILEQLNEVVHSLEAIEVSGIPANVQPPKVVVGFGGCADLFADAVEVLQAVGLSPTNQIVRDLESDRLLNTLKDVEMEFAAYFAAGAAAERYVHSESLFSQLVNAARRLASTQELLGGSGLLMAQRMATEGASVTLAARLSEGLRAKLHSGLQVLKSWEEADVTVAEDEIHLILEYKVGTRWGNLTAPRANRFILVRDQSAPKLTPLEDLAAQMHQLQPNLLILGGLQSMDRYPFPEGYRSKRLSELRDFLSKLPSGIRVHFEMASYVDPEFVLELIEKVVPYADSIGLNEQELPNLVSVLEVGEVTSVSPAFPRTAAMLDLLRRLWSVLSTTPAVLGDGRRRISRVHLHTLGYQVIRVRKENTLWRETRRAAVKASLTAHRYTCGGRGIDAAKSKLLMDDSFSIYPRINSPRVAFNRSEPVSCWDEIETEAMVCVAPVLVCTQVERTVGAGDNISAAGLHAQILHVGATGS